MYFPFLDAENISEEHKIIYWNGILKSEYLRLSNLVSLKALSSQRNVHLLTNRL